MLITFSSILISYLLGSIPSGIIFAKLFNLGDIRNIGSGNTGATNILRTGNYFASALTLLVDALKAIIAINICQNYYPESFLICSIFIFPIFILALYVVFSDHKTTKSGALRCTET